MYFFFNFFEIYIERLFWSFFLKVRRIPGMSRYTDTRYRYKKNRYELTSSTKYLACACLSAETNSLARTFKIDVFFYSGSLLLDSKTTSSSSSASTRSNSRVPTSCASSWSFQRGHLLQLDIYLSPLMSVLPQ